MTFTGSTKTGRQVAAAAAANLTRLSLDFGGKSPNVVYADADLDQAIPGLAHASFFDHGECTVAGSRLYIEESVYDEVVERVAKAAQEARVGNGLDPETTTGPLVSLERFARLRAISRPPERPAPTSSAPNGSATAATSSRPPC